MWAVSSWCRWGLNEDFESRLYACLANRRWAQAVASARHLRDVDGLVRLADQVMDSLTDREWLEAMKAHPRIGERGGDAPKSSTREQSRAMEGSTATLTALAAENRQYEDCFGHVFLIYASGRTAGEILAELRRRMKNDPAAELEEAKGELRKIALLRLRSLMDA